MRVRSTLLFTLLTALGLALSSPTESTTKVALNDAVIANATVTASNCGGNCPGANCPTCPCGTSKNVLDITSWCSQYSGWNQANCRCIVSHESGGNSNAVCYNTNGSYDVGLWQINDYNWASCSGGAAPCSASTNLACAKKVYAWGGNTWKFWSTCSACGACASS